jgi:REP element-mobilizing transposase RayT
LKKEKEEKSWKSSTNLSPFAKSFLGCSHMTHHQKFEIKYWAKKLKKITRILGRNSWRQGFFFQFCDYANVASISKAI